MLPMESNDTALLSRGRRRWIAGQTGAITNWEDFERYPWPKVADADLYSLEYAARHLPEGMAIIAGIDGVLEPMMWLMGFETFAFAIYDQPDLVQVMVDRIADILIPLAQAMVQMDRVVALWMADDRGFKTGPLIAPKHLRRLILPVDKQLADIAHRQGMPFLLHSCGKLDTVMDDLIDGVGIDAKHSFEDVIEPVDSFAARFGHRVAIIGGVDVDLLARGTEEQVRTRTRGILESCAPSRGYVLGSGNSITNYVSPRNYLAMLDEGWRYNSR